MSLMRNRSSKLMKTKFTSYIDDVLKDMDRAEKGNRAKASTRYRDAIKDELAAHAQLSLHRETERKLRKRGAARNVIDGPPGMATGTMYLAIDKYDGSKASYAGAMAPAFHMHLLEFGTVKSPAYPVIRPTGEKIAGELINILSQPIA